MATLIGDYAADHSRFNHAMMPSALPYQQHESQYRSTSRSRDAPARQRSESSPRRVRQAQSRPDDESRSRKEWENPAARPQSKSGPSGVPTPPDSSSPSESNTSETRPHDGDNSPAYMATSDPTSEPSSTSTTQTIVPVSTSKPPTHSIPSPASDGGITWTPARSAAPPPPAAAAAEQAAPRQQKTIHITDLAHIQKLAQLDLATGNGPGILDDPPLQDMKFEISAMPIGDIIEMVAALLTKITTTNDLQHDALNRNATHQRQAQAQNEGSESHSSPFSTSVLAFHGKNVPAITILSYLSRIHKYCPTTYEVFLSLLVYFDRMTERVNDLVIKDEARRKEQQGAQTPAPDPDTAMADRTSDGEETDEDLADSDDDDDDDDELRKEKRTSEGEKPATKDAASSSATYFVVDSFNIHRLIIAGVTCASKFFSDVFYTNSRYAKVRFAMLPFAQSVLLAPFFVVPHGSHLTGWRSSTSRA